MSQYAGVVVTDEDCPLTHAELRLPRSLLSPSKHEPVAEVVVTHDLTAQSGSARGGAPSLRKGGRAGSPAPQAPPQLRCASPMCNVPHRGARVAYAANPRESACATNC